MKIKLWMIIKILSIIFVMGVAIHQKYITVTLPTSTEKMK